MSSSDYECKLFRSMFTTAFYAFLRIGELLYTEGTPSRGLLLSDIQLSLTHAVICIRFSKTDQWCKKCWLKAAAVEMATDCPVVALRQFLAVRPATTKDMGLYIHIDGTPVSRFQFTAVLKKAMAFLDLPVALYKSHSFRIGAATHATINGIPPSVIQQWGRWKSMVYQRYIRIDLTP